MNSHGGAITSVGTAGGSLAISSSTVSDNSAGYGGGIYTANETFDEKDTIIGGNTGGDCFSSFSTINAEHSLDTDDTCGAGSATVTSAALDLGPLVVNAPGTTATQALLQDSVAIDATIDCTDLSGNTITADQRGVARPQGLACDIGAYEYQPGVAQTHTVCADPRCESTTVQGAINNSNDGDTVEIDASLPVVIEQGIDVPRDVTIQGQGPSNTRIQGNGTDSVFHLEQSATIEDLTVSGGATTLSGGGIDSSGGPTATVQVRNVDVTGNSAAGDGGGISASGGATVVVTNTNVSGNTARNHGGGISGEGPVVLTNSTVSNNQVVAPGGLMAQDSSFAGGFMLDDDPTSTMGGGVYADGALTLTDTTISGNSADIGGGIMDNAPYTESSSITGSTISGNTATESGGGIDTLGVLTIDNSTISDNSTAGDGGGIFFRNTALGSLAISNSTMAGNSAAASGGGGIYANGSFDVKSTIIGNSASGSDCAYYYPMPNAVGNLDTDGSCGSGFATVTPMELSLAPLTVNAPGTTATQALFSNSLAIDTAVDCTDFDGIAVVTDQRGVSRPQGPSCDIGAYEYVHVDYIEPLGHGYWKNHLDAVAPLLPVSIDDQYSVNTTDQATAVFRSMNCKDATNCLAGELLTAVLNVENGSDPCIDPTVDSAQDLLSLLGYLGPGGSVPQTKAQRQEALALHSLLGDYNSDMGCPQ